MGYHVLNLHLQLLSCQRQRLRRHLVTQSTQVVTSILPYETALADFTSSLQ